MDYLRYKMQCVGGDDPGWTDSKIVLPLMAEPLEGNPLMMLMLGDLLEELREYKLAVFVRTIGNLFHHSRREMWEVGTQVWSRYSHHGWQPGLIDKITPTRMIISVWSNSGRVYRTCERAWWDLRRRYTFVGKPKPQSGYRSGANALLARTIMQHDLKLASLAPAPLTAKKQRLLFSTIDHRR